MLLHRHRGEGFFRSGQHIAVDRRGQEAQVGEIGTLIGGKGPGGGIDSVLTAVLVVIPRHAQQVRRAPLDRIAGGRDLAQEEPLHRKMIRVFAAALVGVLPGGVGQVVRAVVQLGELHVAQRLSLGQRHGGYLPYAAALAGQVQVGPGTQHVQRGFFCALQVVGVVGVRHPAVRQELDVPIVRLAGRILRQRAAEEHRAAAAVGGGCEHIAHAASRAVAPQDLGRMEGRVISDLRRALALTGIGRAGIAPFGGLEDGVLRRALQPVLEVGVVAVQGQVVGMPCLIGVPVRRIGALRGLIGALRRRKRGIALREGIFRPGARTGFLAQRLFLLGQLAVLLRSIGHAGRRVVGALCGRGRRRYGLIVVRVHTAVRGRAGLSGLRLRGGGIAHPCAVDGVGGGAARAVAPFLYPDVEVQVAGAVRVQHEIQRHARSGCSSRVGQAVFVCGRLAVRRRVDPLELAHDQLRDILPGDTGFAPGDGIDDKVPLARADHLVIPAGEHSGAQVGRVHAAAVAGKLERHGLVGWVVSQGAQFGLSVVLRRVKLLFGALGRADGDPQEAVLRCVLYPVIEEMPAGLPVRSVIIHTVGGRVQLKGKGQQHHPQSNPDGESKALHRGGRILFIVARVHVIRVVIGVVYPQQERGLQAQFGVKLHLQQFHAHARAHLQADGGRDADALPVHLVADVLDLGDVRDGGLVEGGLRIVVQRPQHHLDRLGQGHAVLLFQHHLGVRLPVGADKAADIAGALRGGFPGAVLLGVNVHRQFAGEADVERLVPRFKGVCGGRVVGLQRRAVAAVMALVVCAADGPLVILLFRVGKHAVLLARQEVIPRLQIDRLGVRKRRIGGAVVVACQIGRLVEQLSRRRQFLVGRLRDDRSGRGPRHIGQADLFFIVGGRFGVQHRRSYLHRIPDDPQPGGDLDGAVELEVEIDDGAHRQPRLDAEGERNAEGYGHPLKIISVVQRIVFKQEGQAHRKAHAEALGLELGLVVRVGLRRGRGIGRGCRRRRVRIFLPGMLRSGFFITLVPAEVPLLEEVAELRPVVLILIRKALALVPCFAQGQPHGKAHLVFIQQDGHIVGDRQLHGAQIDAQVHVELAHFAAGVVHIHVGVGRGFILHLLEVLCVGCGGVPAQGNAVRPDGIVRGILHVQGVVIRAGRPSAQLYAGLHARQDIRRGIALLLGDQGERGGPGKGAQVAVHALEPFLRVGIAGNDPLLVPLNGILLRHRGRPGDAVFHGDGLRSGKGIEHVPPEDRIPGIRRSALRQGGRRNVAAQRNVQGAPGVGRRSILEVSVGGAGLGCAGILPGQAADQIAVSPLLRRQPGIGGAVRVDRRHEGGQDLGPLALAGSLRHHQAAGRHGIAGLDKILAVIPVGVFLGRKLGLVGRTPGDVGAEFIPDAVHRSQDETGVGLVVIAVDLAVSVGVPVDRHPGDGRLHGALGRPVVLVVIQYAQSARKIGFLQIDLGVARVGGAVDEQQIPGGQIEADPLDVGGVKGPLRSPRQRGRLGQRRLRAGGAEIPRAAVEGAVAISDRSRYAIGKAVVAAVSTAVVVAVEGIVDLVGVDLGQAVFPAGHRLLKVHRNGAAAGVTHPELVLGPEIAVIQRRAGGAHQLEGVGFFGRVVAAGAELAEGLPGASAVCALIDHHIGDIVPRGGGPGRDLDGGAHIKLVGAVHAALAADDLHLGLEAAVIGLAEHGAVCRRGVAVVGRGHLGLEGVARKNAAGQAHAFQPDHTRVVQLVVLVAVVRGIPQGHAQAQASRKAHAAAVGTGKGIIVIAAVVRSPDRPALVQRPRAEALDIARIVHQTCAALHEPEAGLRIGIFIGKPVQIRGVMAHPGQDLGAVAAEQLSRDLPRAAQGLPPGRLQNRVGVLPAGQGDSLVDGYIYRSVIILADLLGRIPGAVEYGGAVGIGSNAPIALLRRFRRARPGALRVCEDDLLQGGGIGLEGDIPLGAVVYQGGIDRLRLFRRHLRPGDAPASGVGRAVAFGHGAGHIHGLRVIELGGQIGRAAPAGVDQLHPHRILGESAAVVAQQLGKHDFKRHRLHGRRAVVDEFHRYRQTRYPGIEHQLTAGLGVIPSGQGGRVHRGILHRHRALCAAHPLDHDLGGPVRLVYGDLGDGKAKRAGLGIVGVLNAEQKGIGAFQHLSALTVPDGEGRRLLGLRQLVGQRVQMDLLDPLAVGKD